MINEADLKKAIEDCQGETNPNVNTCIRLAAYYTILNNLRRTSQPLNSYASEPVEKVSYYSDSEFSEAITDANMNDVLAVIDELMECVKAMMPKLYNATLERLRGL